MYFILGCVRLPDPFQEFLSQIIFLMEKEPELKKVIMKPCTRAEFCWTCQQGHDSVKADTFIEALIDAGQVKQISQVKYKFPHDTFSLLSAMHI